ncbi:arginine-tRNA-protein transferase [Syncephalastrum racemosum]|uniref:Arginyl-tRNA--protein transferase 1 n=1 Tax=Syncephalastrum racemosum TaxID=13706 RepID=A0A1X2H9Q0_SYNRA|nr:arginine-tRNA-protein transferase [Syncephalastrum racemosum]
MPLESVVCVVGDNCSHCGYCDSDDTSFTYGLWAESLTCEDYQALIDRGWRRSGCYLYKPNLRKSCCPQYTIRLDASRFKPTKSQKKVLNKFSRYIEGTWRPSAKEVGANEEDMDAVRERPSTVNYNNEKALADNLHVVEDASLDHLHKIKFELEPSSFTQEKYDLYRKYQEKIHHDEPDELSEQGFRRFLVDSPLKRKEFAKGDLYGAGYGSYHQKYILDGKLIAVAVLDLLPKCVSSVYFMYDSDYAFLGLGKYSALREISLAQELHDNVSADLHWYYMGYYIHSCPKMVYKGSYQPSDLLDPETYSWYPIEDCKKLLDKKRYVAFSDPEGKQEEKDEERMPGCLSVGEAKKVDVSKIMLSLGGDTFAPVSLVLQLNHSSRQLQKVIYEYIAAVGPDLASRIAIA